MFYDVIFIRLLLGFGVEFRKKRFCVDAAQVLNDFQTFVTDLKSDFERFDGLLPIEQALQNRSDVLGTPKSLRLLGSQEPDIIRRLFGVSPYFIEQSHFFTPFSRRIFLSNIPVCHFERIFSAKKEKKALLKLAIREKVII